MECVAKYGGCGFIFCFKCESPWSTHDTNILNCTRRKFEINYNEQQRKKDLIKYEKYSSYYNIILSLQNKILGLEDINSVEFIRLNLVLSKEIPILDLEYIFIGLSALMKALKVLINSHVLSFYLMVKDAINNLKMNQKKLEETIDEYGQLVTIVSICSLLKITTVDEFQKQSSIFKRKNSKFDTEVIAM